MTSFAHRLGPSQLPVSRRAARTATASSAAARANPTSVSAESTPRTGFDFARIPLHAPAAATVQAKLEVGSAADTHEQEADRVANDVMRAPNARAERAPAQPGRGSAPSGNTAAPTEVGEVLRSPGQALDAATRTFMESRFGYDFSRVRVHTDVAAASSASDLHARAYTAGRDIAFAKGEYAPGTTEGGRLLAHELAHVVQQSSAGAVVQRAPAKRTEPAKTASAKGGGLSTLRAKSAEVQGKLERLSGLKGWRGEFQASSQQKLEEISKLSHEWDQLEQEWQKSQEGWYIFERESTYWIGKRLDRIFDKLSDAYWKTRNATDAEKKYEEESQKAEAVLLKQQSAMLNEIGGIAKTGNSPSPSQYQSLMDRLNKLSVAVDQLQNDELRAATKFTGSGPVSRAR